MRRSLLAQPAEPVYKFGHMSNSTALEPEPPQELTDRQAATVATLVAAALDEVRDSGYEGLTVRRVAARAGTAPATAYNYFASKDHLVTEVFWRRLVDLPDTAVDADRPPEHRLAAALGDLARLVGDEPELAAACTTAMLGADRDVARLRLRIGSEIRRRTTAALGDDGLASTIQAVDLMVTGALVTAGMGHLSYGELTGLFDDMAAIAVKGPR